MRRAGPSSGLGGGFVCGSAVRRLLNIDNHLVSGDAAEGIAGTKKAKDAHNEEEGDHWQKAYAKGSKKNFAHHPVAERAPVLYLPVIVGPIKLDELRRRAAAGRTEAARVGRHPVVVALGQAADAAPLNCAAAEVAWHRVPRARCVVLDVRVLTHLRAPPPVRTHTEAEAVRVGRRAPSKAVHARTKREAMKLHSRSSYMSVPIHISEYIECEYHGHELRPAAAS